jgi:hypothetical protein
VLTGELPCNDNSSGGSDGSADSAAQPRPRRWMDGQLNAAREGMLALVQLFPASDAQDCAADTGFCTAALWLLPAALCVVATLPRGSAADRAAHTRRMILAVDAGCRLVTRLASALGPAAATAAAAGSTPADTVQLQNAGIVAVALLAGQMAMLGAKSGDASGGRIEQCALAAAAAAADASRTLVACLPRLAKRVDGVDAALAGSAVAVLTGVANYAMRRAAPAAEAEAESAGKSDGEAELAGRNDVEDRDDGSDSDSLQRRGSDVETMAGQLQGQRDTPADSAKHRARWLQPVHSAGQAALQLLAFLAAAPLSLQVRQVLTERGDTAREALSTLRGVFADMTAATESSTLMPLIADAEAALARLELA